MSGLPYQGGLNSYMFDVSQYGVNTSVPSGLSTAGNAASMIPYIGPFVGAAMNMAAMGIQNSEQERMYNTYMSPQARMAQMKAAGINPAAAAQGISGSSAPQMNAASPTNAFSSLGEALGNSVNTALTAGNIAAQTKNLESQAKGQDLLNKMTEVELGMKPSMLSAELDDLKADAKQKYQAVAQSKEEVKRIQEEINKLKKEESYIEAQEGAIEYDNKLKQAQERLAYAEKALTESEKALTDVNKEIQEKERDNYLTPEERIKMPIETSYNVDPIHADFTDAHKAVNSLNEAINQCYDNERILFEKFRNGEISNQEYIDGVHSNDQTREELRLAKKTAERAYDKLSYTNGYHTWWQDNASSLINSASSLAGTLGSAAIHNKGLKSFGAKSPGFRRKVFD